MTDQPRQDPSNLEHSDPAIRRQTLQSIIDESPRLADWTIPLLRAACDPHASVSELAIATLEDMGAPDASQVADIVAFAQRPADSETVYWATTLIGRIGPAAADAVPTLAGVLANSSFLHVREKAAWALGQIGPAAVGASAVLQSAAEQGPPRLQRLATKALAAMAGSAAA
ncbi:HEAT repeat protein [Rosistilla oblonga]|uniref:HEAT repeat protein n=1 Tax=Rosistilla oblonga TaxID=2527990 RepID=A0A518IM33_9BACT|nr:HEAT repeat domain-containing protein [Rosistilla oblonga]QDV10251.1 HEAT repeat protein [Rosistilla oblonga]QDV54150.1 HEAT repeat protein [Rosistilla oblonga]